ARLHAELLGDGVAFERVNLDVPRVPEVLEDASPLDVEQLAIRLDNSLVAGLRVVPSITELLEEDVLYRSVAEHLAQLLPKRHQRVGPVEIGTFVLFVIHRGQVEQRIPANPPGSEVAAVDLDADGPELSVLRVEAVLRRKAPKRLRESEDLATGVERDRVVDDDVRDEHPQFVLALF